jgi:hypothetical protein
MLYIVALSLVLRSTIPEGGLIPAGAAGASGPAEMPGLNAVQKKSAPRTYVNAYREGIVVRRLRMMLLQNEEIFLDA